MPLVVIGAEENSKSATPKFENSQTKRFIQTIFEILIQGRVTPFVQKSQTSLELENDLFVKDAQLFCHSIVRAPFHVDVLCCIDDTHVPLERWTLSLIESSEPPSSSFLSTVNNVDINIKNITAVEGAVQRFLKLLPFHNFVSEANSKLPWRVKYGQTAVSSSFKTDGLNKFSFQPVETAFGTFSVVVDYLPQLDFLTGRLRMPDMLIIRPSHSHSVVVCNCSTTAPLRSSLDVSKDTSSSASLWSTSSSSSPNSVSFSSTDMESFSERSFSSPLRSALHEPVSPDISPIKPAFSPSIPIASPTTSIIRVPGPFGNGSLNIKVSTTPTFSFSPPRPGTPPPSQRLLARSAPVRIPRAKTSSASADVPTTNPLSVSMPGLLVGDDDEDEDEMAKKVRSRSFSSSPSELIGHFVGSFQESLLSGHMSNTPCTTYSGFMANLGASGPNFIANQIKIPFSVLYYHVEHDTPYVGTIELDKKGYKVAQKGMIQLTISNPSHTPIKTFLVKYDLTTMPIGTKTFVRQKTMTPNPHVLRYAIHLKFVSPKKNRFYLYKSIRVVFAHRMPDDTEALQILMDYPDEPKYFPYSKGSSASKTLSRSLSFSGETNTEEKMGESNM